MKRALVGYTGFVGGNLHRQSHFDFLYNSKNFNEIKGQSFDEVVCAGISAVKWQANKDPQTDREKIKALEDVLSSITAKRFILISTIDVYPVAQGVDESFDCHSMDNHAYGTHRLAFEDFCLTQFPECYIVRLPGLFGDGLKKNVIYDLLNDNCLEMINPKSAFQYYYLSNLWSDIQVAIKANVRLVNFFTEPVSSAEIIQRYFPDKAVGQNPLPEAHYDLRTCYASLWGKVGSYIYSKEEVINQLDEFITNNHK
ncbi:MAG: hypothetical protein AMJ55_10030 [Gammaproteobacteria bacterium SG8_15]|nr:MAG: hypothetical protein AMJ55_10030 [Gammaproteobacteria bacterium SG8_15]